MTVDLEETQLLQDIKSSDYFHESALKNLVENSALAADLSKLLYKHPNINLPLETNVQQQLFDKLRVIHQDSLAKKYYFRDISEFPQVLATEDQVSNLALSNLDIHGRLSDLNSEIDQINLSLSDNISKLEEGKGKLNESLQNLSILKQKAGESELEKVRLSTLKQVITDQEISDKKQYLTQQIEKNAQLTSKLSDPMQKHAVLDMTRQALLKEIEQLESSKLQMEEFANQTIIHANAVDPRLDYLGKWLTKTKSIMYGISGIESIISSEKDIVISYEKDGEVDAFKLTLTFNESEATFINAKVFSI